MDKHLNRGKRLHAEFVNTSLEVASTFLAIAATAYSRGDSVKGDRAVAKASDSLYYARRYMGYLSSVSSVETRVLQDKLFALCERRADLCGIETKSDKIIKFPAA